MKIAFIGLGNIGFHVAGHLAKSGHEVTVHNQTRSKAEHWVEVFPGVLAESPNQAVQGADVVITCVGDDHDLEALFFDGDLVRAVTGGLTIDHTTASASIARRLHTALSDAGVGFVDAPVSGGSIGAEAGTLSVMAGGSPGNFDKAESIMRTYARAVAHVGGPGAGQATKMVNQVCIAGILEGLAEGLALAKAEDLDQAVVIDAIRAGAAGSWQMDNRADFMIREDFPAGFAAKLMSKDLGISLRAAAGHGLALPVATVVADQYRKLANEGHETLDFSALYLLLDQQIS